MIEKYGLFDSLEGDEREYAEVDFARLGRALGKNGVRGGADALAVSAAASGLAVTVAPGLAMIEGRYYELEDDGSGEKTLSLTAASANPRIDRIVLTLDAAARTIALSILKGTEAASPAPPALVRNDMKHMLSLAQVRVPVGAGALTTANITDERADEAVCGLYLVSADAAMKTAAEAKAKADGALKVFTKADFSMTSLVEILNALPEESVFYGNASDYYSMESNNLPSQWGVIAMHSLNKYRKYITMTGAVYNDSLENNGLLYIASISADGVLTWDYAYTQRHKPTPAAIGAIPTVPGAKEGGLPVFDDKGNLAASACTPVKMELSGATLIITTLA